MSKMSSVRRSTICALCIALCIVLPVAFHALGVGAVFLPMHIPVFLCALTCGWGYGMFCGIAGCVLSSLLTGMPTITGLPAMAAELAIYGLITGLLIQIIHTKNVYADLYLSVVAAMILGRVAAGVTNALIFARGVTYSLAMWASAYLFTSWPGTILILIAVPALILALMRAKLIPERYPKAGGRKA